MSSNSTLSFYYAPIAGCPREINLILLTTKDTNLLLLDPGKLSNTNHLSCNLTKVFFTTTRGGLKSKLKSIKHKEMDGVQRMPKLRWFDENKKSQFLILLIH